MAMKVPVRPTPALWRSKPTNKHSMYNMHQLLQLYSCPHPLLQLHSCPQSLLTLTHLQWTSRGPELSGNTFLMCWINLIMEKGCWGTPWSGQVVKKKCFSLSGLEDGAPVWWEQGSITKIGCHCVIIKCIAAFGTLTHLMVISLTSQSAYTSFPVTVTVNPLSTISNGLFISSHQYLSHLDCTWAKTWNIHNQKMKQSELWCCRGSDLYS